MNASAFTNLQTPKRTNVRFVKLQKQPMVIGLFTFQTNKVNNLNIFFQELYKNFNDRNIDLVVAQMTDDVKWANGMEGGYVYSHKGVKEYWTRQFKMISSKVTPLEMDANNGVVKIKVRQVVHDLNGNLLADETVYHFFHLRDNKISQFDIAEKIEN